MTGWRTDRWIYSMTDETACLELELAGTERQKGLKPARLTDRAIQVSYGRCVMPGSPMGQSEALSR